MLETWSQALQKPGAHHTIPTSLGCPPKEETPPAEPTTLPARDDVKDTPPGTAEIPLGGGTTVLLAISDVETPKDLPASQATSPTKVETQVVPTTRLVVELAGPLTPSDWTGEERQCVLTVAASMGWLNLEATSVTPRDMVTASVWRVAFENPQIVAVLPGPTKGRKVVGCQDTTMEELIEKDLVGNCP